MIIMSAVIRLYETVIRRMVIYGCETWVLIKNAENILEIWERKIFRKIYDGIKEVQMSIRRGNKEVMELYDKPLIAIIVKKNKDLCLPEERAARAGSRGKRGRPRKKLMEAAEDDLK